MVIPTLERESLDNKVQVSLRDPVSKHKMSDLRDHIKAWHLSYKYMHTNMHLHTLALVPMSTCLYAHLRAPCRRQTVRTTRRDKNENPVQSDFVNLEQTSGSLMPGGSLSAYLKHGTVGGRFPGSNQANRYNSTAKRSRIKCGL